MSKENYVIGLMSGTSIDGIDAAVVKIITNDDQMTVKDVELVHFLSVPFSKTVEQKINRLCQPHQATIEDLSMMNMLLGELYAEASLQAIEEANLSREDILFISSHGQTIFHQPDPVQIDDYKITSTLQIGDISVIAEKTGITTIGDFRTRDMAVGGEGAPLVPYGDYLFFKDQHTGRVLVNIGGIANMTILKANCKKDEVIAYDTGPGNMMIDAFTNWATDGEKTYDKNGAIAASGTIDEDLLKELLAHDYYKLDAPKSTGREMFGLDYAKKLWDEANHLNEADKIATITALTARTIAMEIKQQAETNKIDEVIVSGGGSYNETLMKLLASYVPDSIQVMTMDELGLSADAKEAVIFGILGYQCYHRQTNNLPSATGAEKEVIMGKIAWGI